MPYALSPTPACLEIACPAAMSDASLPVSPSAAVRELMAIEHMGGAGGEGVCHCRDSLCSACFRILLRHGTSQVSGVGSPQSPPAVRRCAPGTAPRQDWPFVLVVAALFARASERDRQPTSRTYDEGLLLRYPLVASQLHTTVGKHVNRLE